MALFIYGIANLIGLIMYQSSVLAILHTIKMEERDAPDFGDSLNFITTGLPILAVCLLFNIAWVVKALINALGRREFLGIIAAALVLAIWLASVVMVRVLN